MSRAEFAAEERQAALVAEQAGQLLLEILRRDLEPKERGDQGDHASNTFILDRLRRAFPGDAVLTEESPDDLARLSAKRLWIIDPLDGTREFGEGRTDWAVHVAFLHDDKLAAGAVALPGRGLTLSTATASAPGSTGRRLKIAVSRTRAPEIVHKVAATLDAELVPFGSAGYKSMSVVLGETDAYIHAGGQYQWDLAAPAAVAEGAGLHVSRIDGSPLRFNQESTWLPDVLICRPELAARILELLA